MTAIPAVSILGQEEPDGSADSSGAPVHWAEWSARFATVMHFPDAFPAEHSADETAAESPPAVPVFPAGHSAPGLSDVFRERNERLAWMVCILEEPVARSSLPPFSDPAR